MSRVYGRRCKLVGIILVLGLAVMHGCAGGGDTPAIDRDMPAIDWDSPQMREIQAEWISLQDARFAASRGAPGAKVNGKDLYIQLLISIDRLFQARLSARPLRELAASSKVPADTHDYADRGFVDDMLAFMVRAFVQTGDRESLVQILSKRCPSRVWDPLTVEYYLAFRGWKLRDPMLIFSEAYARSQVSDTRHTLATAVRRGFAGLGVREKDDAEFIKKAMQWYKKEKDHLIVNTSYPGNELSPMGITVGDTYEAYPDLFDNPRLGWQQLFKVVPPGGPTNLGEDPDR